MATTANNIIRRALRLLGAISVGEAVSADDSQDCLEALNAMLGSWANERLMVHVLSLDEVPLVPGKQAYTIGPGGDIDTVRPTSIDSSSYLLWGDVSFPLSVLTAQEYNSICMKSLQGTIPQAIWYLHTFPLGQITLYGVPSVQMTLNLWSAKPFAEFTSLTQEVNLPPGYDDALASNLAVVIGPEYDREASPTVQRRAAMTKKLLKRTNLEVPILQPNPDLQSWPRFNIYSGE